VHVSLLYFDFVFQTRIGFIKQSTTKTKYNKKKRKMSSEGVAVGLKKGHVVTKIEKVVRPSNTKGRISKRTKLVRELIGEVAGLSPYEKRLLDMLKTGGASSEKRMYKYAKRRVSKFYYMDILLFNNSLVVGFSLIILL